MAPEGSEETKHWGGGGGQASVCDQWLAPPPPPPMICLLRAFRRHWYVLWELSLLDHHHHHHHQQRLNFIFPTLWGWTVHFLDGCSPCCPVSWVNVGNIRRSSVLCFSPCFLRGLPRAFLPATGKFKILWSQWVCSLLSTCPYYISQSALPHHLSYTLTRPIDWRRSSFFFLSHSDVLHIHLTILISAFSIRSMLDDFIAHVLLP